MWGRGIPQRGTDPARFSWPMKIILNNFEGSTSFQRALQELIEGAETLSLAVSYLQVGGWELFREHAQGLSQPKMRIICTDQLGITHPEAVKRALASRVKIRNFAGAVTYHPKVFLAHNGNGRPTRFLLGRQTSVHLRSQTASK
jgi:HKD family nuclease